MVFAQGKTGRNGVAAGFTLIEIMIVIVLMGILTAVAVPVFASYRERAQVVAAMAGIRVIEKEVIGYALEYDAYPPSLAAVGLDTLKDPWGRPYQYLRIEGSTKKSDGKPRKDRFLVPINTDFDLYSMGTDGISVAPLTAKASWDDIIRANDGQYVGRATGY